MRRATLLSALACVLAAPASAVGAEMVAEIPGAVDAVRAADGSLLVIQDDRIWRVPKTGKPAVVAGSEEEGFAGDGGPASQARFRMPLGLAALPDGGYLVADRGNHRVRRVAADGTIDTVMGGGFLGPGCPAEKTAVGHPLAVKRLSDGGMVVLSEQGSLFRTWPDGSSGRIAEFENDVRDVEQEADGSLLVGGWWNWVDRIRADGSVSRVLGKAYDGHHTNGLAPMLDGGFLIVSPETDLVRRFWPYGALGAEWDDPQAPRQVTADAQGGALVSDARGVHHVGWDAPWPAPAAPGFGTAPTGGLGGACRGLDPDFGIHIDPRAKYPTSHPRPMGLIAEPDGRVVVAVHDSRGERDGLGLLRFSPDGKLDTSFGSDGGAWLYRTYDSTQSGGLARLSDGRYVAATSHHRPSDSSDQLTIAAFTAGGQLDTTFAGDGSLELEGAHRHAAVFAGDGDVITVVTETGNQLRVLRLTAGGEPVAGWPSEPLPAGVAPLTAAAVQPDGRILAAGGPNVVRVGTDGRLDPSWGDGGIVSVGVAGYTGSGLAVQPDGKVLLAGMTWNQGRVSRLLADGRPDPAFGGDGLVTFENPRNLRDVAVRADGRIVVAGAATSRDGGGAALLGLLPDGRVDPALGPDGLVVSPLSGSSVYTRVLLQPDGKTLAAGGMFDDLILSRYEIGAAAGTSGGGPPEEPSQHRPAAVGTDAGAQPATGSPTAARDAAAAARAAVRASRRIVLRVGRVPTKRAFARRGLPVTVRGSGTVRLRLLQGRRTIAAARATLGARPVTVRLRPALAWRRRAARLTLVAERAGRRVAERRLVLRP